MTPAGDLNQVSYITGRGRAVRDAAIVTLFVALAVALSFQIKANNSIDTRQHESCVSRRQLAQESRRRQFVLERFLETAADSRLQLSRHDRNPQVRAINFNAAHYWKYTLAPMIHTVPIPASC